VLESWLRMPTLSQELSVRARAVLASAEGEAVRSVAGRLRISPNTVAVRRRPIAPTGSIGCAPKREAGVLPNLPGPRNRRWWRPRSVRR
jgi:hypothetical protein